MGLASVRVAFLPAIFRSGQNLKSQQAMQYRGRLHTNLEHTVAHLLLQGSKWSKNVEPSSMPRYNWGSGPHSRGI